MHRDTDRIARLQRIAYGAGSDDDARAEAAAELAAIFRPLAAQTPHAAQTSTAAQSPHAAQTSPERPGAGPSEVGTAQPFTFDALIAAVSSGDGDDETDAARGGGIDDDDEEPGLAGFFARHRTAVLPSAVALGVGLAMGWGLGASGTSDLSEPAPPTEASGGTIDRSYPTIPVAASAATALFERPQTEVDVPVFFADPTSGATASGSGIDPTSTRLIGERDDGLKVYGARDENGIDVCLLLGVGSGLASTCTSGGRMDQSGLTIEGTFEQPYGAVGVIWQPDGSLAWMVH